MVEKIVLANPRGFCAGVSRAIDIVELALERFGKPIYVRHAIVHNDHVVKDLEKKGAIFVETLEEIPSGSRVIFSAHGSPPTLKQQALDKGLIPIDAVCPLVTKVHVEARRYLRNGYTIIYIGHKGHQEAIGVTAHGTMHLVETVEDVENLNIPSTEHMALLTQTTLSIDDTKKTVEAIKQKYPHIKIPPKEDICYATTNRQGAVKEMAKQTELILVVGSPTSSNSVRLVETAKYSGVDSYLISDKNSIDFSWLVNVKNLGVTSGASVPDDLVFSVIDFIKEQHPSLTVEKLTVAEENVQFVMPEELKT